MTRRTLLPPRPTGQEPRNLRRSVHGVQLLPFLRHEAPGGGRGGREERKGAPQGVGLARAEIAGRLQGCPPGIRGRDTGSKRLSCCYQQFTDADISSSEVSSARTQLDLLEQLTSSSTPNGTENETATETRVLTTIREQLVALYGDRGGEFTFTLPLGKRLREGLKTLNTLTVSQRRNIKRQAMLTKVSGRNDSVFFATVGAFVLVPPIAILAIAVLTGYVQLLP
ncbi:uncharacterized protein LOC119268593 isoform X1 [Triticum dicoccoides]|uniref:uncharacterized protein LOC119268593 isoform X1 n=1 Tax=Triticum dicoccoides TaxID=85692 RepID=UPI00188F91A4|nr:uncharacterized protein LOC119268593 isoform X1 [Triticum dicoccoides]XP_044340818.1 uncharacterized protein LOC123061684 isoform X1 [Triticum aestivum]